jgi:hypothetical protein
LTVTLLNKQGEAVNFFYGVKNIQYSVPTDKFLLTFKKRYEEYTESVWANGGSLKVEG